MMTRIPVDAGRLTMLVMGVSPVPVWQEQADGRRKPTAEQARDKNTGLLLWTVKVAVEYEGGDFPVLEMVTVEVGTDTEPALRKGSVPTFENLVMRVWQKDDGTLSTLFKADEVWDGNAEPSRASSVSVNGGV